MKRYTTALLFCTLSLAGQLAHADVIDDDDYDGRYQGSRQQSADRQWQYDDRRRQPDERQRKLDNDRRQLENDLRRLDDDY